MSLIGSAALLDLSQARIRGLGVNSWLNDRKSNNHFIKTLMEEGGSNASKPQRYGGRGARCAGFFFGRPNRYDFIHCEVQNKELERLIDFRKECRMSHVELSILLMTACEWEGERC